jgi:hypothetical protein
MKTYLIKITHGDGIQSWMYGLYSDGFDAAIDVLEMFPDAKRISARRLP